MTVRTTTAACAIVVTAVALSGCRVSVDKDHHSDKAVVDITSPLGDLSVRTGVESPDTGLRVYPGARPLHDSNDNEPANANVNIANRFFDLKVVAAKFASDGTPEAIAGFYKTEMQAYGEVTECRGNINFKDIGGRRRPVCRERASSRDLQLVAGVEDQHRIVVIKPRGQGTEFSVVYVNTHGS